MLSPLLPLARDALLVLLGLPEEFCLEVRGGVGQSGLALVRSLDAGCLAFTRYFLYFLVVLSNQLLLTVLAMQLLLL